MRQTNSKTHWLTLSQAAKRLNVHPTTLRRWADEGQIPFMLTPGGHRRFADSDVLHMAERRHTVRELGPVERVWANHALEQTRKALVSQGNGELLSQYDEEARNHHRTLGQELMAIALRYLTSVDHDDELIEQARRIGREYGRKARDVGLTVADVLRVFNFFRDTLVLTAIELPENVRIPAGSQARLVNRIHTVLNTVQLGIAEQYSDRRG
jgi:excisionase family DNA binding protein